MDAWNNVGFAGAELKIRRRTSIAMAAGAAGRHVVRPATSLPDVLPIDNDRPTWTEGGPVGTAAMQQMFGQGGLTIMGSRS